ncbi:MAG: hypothetical protein PHD04_02740 [Candidatus Pacebacteria bacterium]|nr:hypothetical protein [Candidatus Paceibacterota bacterium]
MRTLLIATFVLIASFGAPMFSYAQDTGTAPASQSGDNTGTAPAQVTNPSQTPSRGTNVTLMNPLGKDATFESFLLSILGIITDTIGPIIVILMLVYVGFKFVTAQGEPGKISEARQMLLWTVVGALILLGAKIIAMGILATVNALAG